MTVSSINQLVTQQNSPAKFGGMDSTAVRTIEEVKGAIMVAKLCPRNENLAIDKIIRACDRRTLAEKSLYEYERGDTAVEGPSIRLAEAILLNWGNAQSGVRELETNEDETKYEAFAWDVENNIRSSREFTVKHIRQSKASGTRKLTDQRDIYEVVANHGARRRRACILEIIPSDVVEAAVERCKATLLALAGDTPKEQRINSMLESFVNLDIIRRLLIPMTGKQVPSLAEVTDQMKILMEKKYGCKVDALSELHLVKLRAIFQGLQDGYANPENVFEFKVDTSNGQGSKADSINAILN